MGQSNPQPGDEYRSKNEDRVYEVQEVDDTFVTIQHPQDNFTRQIPHSIFSKAYVEV